MSDDPAELLHAYDHQLRHCGEVCGAESTSEDGPIIRALFDHGGFVAYRSLAGVDDLDALIDRTVAYFRDDTEVEEIEWKTRGHDQPADLDERLRAHGFEPDEVETVMVGSVDHLVDPVALPDGVRVRRAGVDGDLVDDVTRANALQNEVFGDGRTAAQALARLERSEGRATHWIAETDARDVVCAGRLELVEGTEFAGLWGGATKEGWRGKGIYRALTAARARHARDLGVRYLHSDCSSMSRPILERSGLVKITTTTPYVWRRDAQSGT